MWGTKGDTEIGIIPSLPGREGYGLAHSGDPLFKYFNEFFKVHGDLVYRENYSSLLMI